MYNNLIKEAVAHARVVLTVGVPGCGKSTFAKTLVERHGFIQLELDEIRAELGDRQDMALTMPAIALRDERLAAAVAAGHKVVISDTNTVAQFRRELVERLEVEMGLDDGGEVVLINFKVSTEVAKARNVAREWPVPEAVIDRMSGSLAADPVECDHRYFGERGLLGPHVINLFN